MFIDRGKISIGFEVNKEEHKCLMFKDKLIIGAYGITFNRMA